MKTLRYAAGLFPAYRNLFIGIGYASVFVGGTIWFFCFVIPVLIYTFTGSARLLLPVPYEYNSLINLLPVIYWAITLFGLVMLYFQVRYLRTFRLKP